MAALPVYPREARQARRLLRALLREATYLPDHASRLWFRSHIMSRFKDYHPTGTDKDQHNLRFTETRIAHAMKNARKSVGQLRRANDGELAPLTKVLLHTYGRVGKRRFQLMAPLMKPDPIEETDDLSTELTKLDLVEHRPMLFEHKLPRLVDPPSDRDQRPLKYQISKRYSRLRALLVSQLTAQPVVPRRPKLRSLSLTIPDKNAWLRPFPVKREVNLVEEWVASVLEKIFAPLPDEEWDRLHALATGKQKWDGLRPRRARAINAPDEPSFWDLAALAAADGISTDRFLTLECRRAGVSEEGSEAEKLARIAKSPTFALPSGRDRWILDPASREHVIDQVLRDQLDIKHINKKFPDEDRPRKITPRLMQRLWAKVFSQCPKVFWDFEKQRWQVQWGNWADLFQPPKADAALADMFAGVNEKGQLLRPQKS